MCGIVACIGTTDAADVVLRGLEQLEYRGYDSAGAAFINGEQISLYRCKGKVAELNELLDKSTHKLSTAIGHTRWATHGEPSELNAHPHVSNSGRFALVHNGIIENYAEIKKFLQKNGYTFSSETDTEVLVNLIDFYAGKYNDVNEAVRKSLKKVSGAYAIALLDTKNSKRMLVARKGSPLVVGVGDDGAYFAASDASPLIRHTKTVIFLEDNEMAVLQSSKKPKIIDISTNSPKDLIENEIDIDITQHEKGGFHHFMLKEIYEQPEAILNSLRGRVLPKDGVIKLGGIEEYEQHIAKAERLIFVACGTSWHAALSAEYFFEELAGIPVEVEYASEFRYRNPIIRPGDVVVAISQSGETADTLAALQMAKEKGALILGICNVAGSSIARLTDAGIYTHAGPEVSVASTKAFSTQVSVLLAFALRVAVVRATVGPSRLRALATELYSVPEKIEQILLKNDEFKQMATKLSEARDVLYIGRGVSLPVALEGALKLKEISYIHAEGYPAGEMKHGPIALVDENTPVIVIAPNDRHYQKTISNLQEIKARKGRIILVTNDENYGGLDKNDGLITVPEADELISPLLTNIPLQLLAYHVAAHKGLDIDQPRNLAKSVTVE